MAPPQGENRGGPRSIARTRTEGKSNTTRTTREFETVGAIHALRAGHAGYRRPARSSLAWILARDQDE
jgi:hypothetical protein